ncbi:hypothetical protein HYDPIDRAFT_120194, partial [Hydnomerulius pinastri MD-312]
MSPLSTHPEHVASCHPPHTSEPSCPTECPKPPHPPLHDPRPLSRRDRNHPSLSHPLARAAEIFRSAVQHKQKGDHDEALRLYHLAFPLDHHIDRGYLKRLQFVSVLAQEITRRL